MEKLSFYELLSWIVPGSLLVASANAFFPEVGQHFAGAGLPESFRLTALIALAVFLGQIAESLTSLIDPLLQWTWGGRASEVALQRGLGNRYLPIDSAIRIRSILVDAIGHKATDRSLFLFAIQRATASGSTKVETFNALYGYHRVLLTLSLCILLMFSASRCFGLLPQVSNRNTMFIVCGLTLVSALLWYRARQRGYYFVREVLLSAERVLTVPAPATLPTKSE